MCSLPSPDRIPFVYIIRDTSNNKRYAGVKFSKGCKPTDLLTKYFTSSKKVKQLIQEGREFVIDKIIEFDTKEDAIEFEELLLLTANAHLLEDWYNKAAGRAINPDAVKETCIEKYGVSNAGRLPEVREKVKNTCLEKFGAKSRFESADFEEARRASMISNHGVEFSMQSPVLREKAKASYLSKYGVENPSQIASSRELNSKLMTEKNKVKIICENCGKYSNIGNYNRWHGKNCRHGPREVLFLVTILT